MVYKRGNERKDGKAQKYYLVYIGIVGSVSCAILSHSNLVWLEPVAAGDCECCFLRSFRGTATVQKESSTPPQQCLFGIYSCIFC